MELLSVRAYSSPSKFHSLLFPVFFLGVSRLCQLLFQAPHCEETWTFQLMGGPSCERRRVHSTKINGSCLSELSGRNCFLCFPKPAQSRRASSLGRLLPLALSPFLPREVCPLSLVTAEKQVWRRSRGSAPTRAGDSSSHVPLHVRSTELLPNLCLVLLRPGSSCPCVGYKFVTGGGGGHLQKVHFCCHFLSSVTFAPSQYSLPCVPRHSSCTGLTCSLAILTGFELAL